jgi:hypothetical protein
MDMGGGVSITHNHKVYTPYKWFHQNIILCINQNSKKNDKRMFLQWKTKQDARVVYLFLDFDAYFLS